MAGIAVVCQPMEGRKDVHSYVCMYMYTHVRTCMYVRIQMYSATTLIRSPRDQEICPDYRGGWNRQVNSNMWVTFGTKQSGQFRQCDQLIQDWIREVSW